MFSSLVGYCGATVLSLSGAQVQPLVGLEPRQASFMGLALSLQTPPPKTRHAVRQPVLPGGQPDLQQQ